MSLSKPPCEARTRTLQRIRGGELALKIDDLRGY
jgi:hypothetical protein